MSGWHGGKGSTPRQTDKEKYNTNWDKIFKPKEQKDKKKDEPKDANRI
jgi:hypothetical protein|tara:strand:+ start:477 stop:620 length:144 start_codon:yes stop_codon:yes gene_type:complete